MWCSAVTLNAKVKLKLRVTSLLNVSISAGLILNHLTDGFRWTHSTLKGTTLTVIIAFVSTENAIDGVFVLMTFARTLVLFGTTAVQWSVGSPKKSTNGWDRRSGSSVAQTLFDEPVSDLPGKYARILATVLFYAFLDVRSGHSWLWAADNTRSYWTRFLNKAKDFWFSYDFQRGLNRFVSN